ncbi:uncharacterized protein C9orf152-like [Denticeps clupeoides]|uniref:uncharacterized protein C9orf152-like n=1 Tax=Denticeps clupeoides TaxID=299321 RepID=UPI0010A4918A|nr:uncharacterized protein C9orf152 homolog [Denticeps clupeoides]
MFALSAHKTHNDRRLLLHCGRMWCCCPDPTTEDPARQEEEEEPALPALRMDVALLREQYGRIRETQRRDRRVLLFGRASNDEEISGKSLIRMVPMCQEAAAPFERPESAKDVQFDFVRDYGSSPWRTHLGIHRMTRSTRSSLVSSSTKASSSMESNDYGDKLTSDPEEQSNPPRQKETGEDEGEVGAVGPRKQLGSRPALSRQWSLGGYQSSPAHSATHHYPFPQMKCPRKSEAARRLGMYSSF